MEVSMTSLFQLINTVLLLGGIYFIIKFFLYIPRKLKNIERDISEIKAAIIDKED